MTFDAATEPSSDPLEHVEDASLSAVLDALVPPDGDLPGAGGLGLGQAVRSGARQAEPLGVGASRVLDALPAGFGELTSDQQVEQLALLEQRDPAAFGALVNLTYNAYYTDPRVLERIEAKTGYAARPPQPEGYELPPFDEQLLEVVRQREPFWREA